ncbi:UDP-N-acetylglucosamine--N-acetylmuramyl-(pentapeptide) pyrophosphoryl-undecaprenol N-acetylglucosamine transferase [Mycoplasmatota bacterium]|nr:UDP-N-acetylglucosamine--N-acetylmuramyl-(pentapeptide) pyrophosphoryl-undecaprenol N-acetylglucosamine transferase [Mycoplasmatota bacterium]
MKVVIAAGGSGGHLYPALSLAEHLKKSLNCHITLINSTKEIEKKIVEGTSFLDEIISLDITGLHRKISYKNIITFYKLFISIIKSRAILKKIEPNVVIGLGGYVSFPVLISASKYHTFIHEQNVIPGLVNKVLSKVVDNVFISFTESEKYFKKNTILIKNPRVLDLKYDVTFSNRILIVGGSQGSKVINDAVIKQYESLKNMEITLVTGTRYYDEVKKEIDETDNFKIVSYLDHFREELIHSRLIVCRAGATTISEIIELEKPSILIPSSYVSNDHQTLNAKVLSDASAGLLLEESSIDTLSNIIKDLDKDKLFTMKENIKIIKRRDYLDVISIIKERVGELNE